MEVSPEKLAEDIVQAYRALPDDRRLLVAIAGPPGSGKSTLAYPLTDHLNALLTGHLPAYPSHIEQPRELELAEASPHQGARGGKDEIAICVGLDGWHFSREELDRFEDPQEAHWRRGAAFTFNQPAYHDFLLALRQPLQSATPSETTTEREAVSTSSADTGTGTGAGGQAQPAPGTQSSSQFQARRIGIPFPTFSHSLKDPETSPYPISPQHRIIVIEGLYTLLSREGWKDSAEMMDIRVWVDVDREMAKERVVRRNFEAGIVDDLEACRARVDAVDMANGEEVRTHRVQPTHIITSVEGQPFSAHAFKQ